MYEFRLLEQCVVGRLRTPGLPHPAVPPTRSEISPRRREPSSVVFRPASERFVRAAAQVRREFGYLFANLCCWNRYWLCCGAEMWYWTVWRGSVPTGEQWWCCLVGTVGNLLRLRAQSSTKRAQPVDAWGNESVQHSDEPGKSLVGGGTEMKILNLPVRNYLYKERKCCEVCLV